MFDGRFSTDLKRKVTYFLGLLSILVLVAGCGTQRKNPISKWHHATNTHFNYQYNAERLWGETVKEVNATFRVPPEGFIPVMYVGDQDASKTFSSQFDEVIRKCDVAGEKHKSLKWKDDLRFLVGRTHFYKQNYFMAIQNFRYVADTFPESKHVTDCYIWMVKAYHKNGNEILAQQVLDEKLKGRELNKRQIGDLAIIKADVALAQENYDEVIKTLNANFKYIKGKLNRARAHYLLGQIYASRGQIAKAEPHFKAVSKMNTDYELIFNAKLSIASLYVGDKGDALERERVSKMLRRMLRDYKNADYKDQIYYQLALVEQGAGHLDPAIKYLKSSIAYNTNNQRQKALSYYRIGQIYFYDKKEFKMAEAYFDSAATSINKDAPEYREVSTISKTLKEYVKHLNTIHYQDSMIALAKLDSASLNRRINAIMAEEQRKEQEKQQAMMDEIDRMSDPNLFNQGSGQGGGSRGGSSGGFYFANPADVENGRVEFRKVWGQRKNEDHWNRKHKSVSLAQDEESSSAPVDSGLVKKYGNKAKYYKDIPKTPEEIDARHAMIMEAMFGLGTVYNNKLSMPDSAVAVFTRLTRRYPDSEYYLKALYAIYKIHEKAGDPEADEVKSRICGKDPGSLYCKLCNNQDVQSDIKAQDAEFQGAYTALYGQYQAKEYSTCVDFSNFISQRFLGHQDMPKVYYLRGLSYGYMGLTDSLRNIFTFVKDNYPQHEITPIVIKTLERMNGGKPSEASGKPVADGGTPAGDKFKDFKSARGPSENVFVILMVSKEKTTSSDLQIKVNDFGNKSFASDKLTTSIFFYQKRLHMAYVSKFTDERAALTYIRMLQRDPAFADYLAGGEETIAFITPTNFRVAYGQQKLAEYLEFYQTVLLPSFQ